MFSWIRRLFARSATPVSHDRSVVTAVPGTGILPPSEGASVAWNDEPEPARITIISHTEALVPYTEQLRDRLDAADAAREVHRMASQQPDAAALIDMLRDGPESVIRQLPAAARDTIALIDDPSMSRSRLADVLGRDPALVQGLLRTANSAAFGADRDSVLSVGHALDRIGVTGTRGVVLAGCVEGLLSHPGGEFNVMASQVWSHMVRTAPYARAVAPAFAADADEAFAVALLHDVGKLAIFDRMSVLRTSRRRPLTIATDFVHTLLQLVHEPLGALAAERWGMGERAASAIGQHHRTVQLAQRDSLAEVLFLAERADHASRRSESLDLDGAWAAGRLTGSPARAGDALQRLHRAA